MKKKLYGVSSSLTKGIRDTLSAVENNLDNFRFSVVNLNQIELDPDNPRDLVITLEDLAHDPVDITQFDNKQKQDFERLVSLSETIKKKGLINPVVLYKHQDKYRLVAGERRFLASHLAKKEDIQARILSEKPNEFDLRLLQWIENNERVDLSLKERVGNVRAILDAYKVQNNLTDITSRTIKDIIGISHGQASCYHQVIHAPKDVIAAIETDQIKNLDKAAMIATVKSYDLRKRLIDLCIQGATLSALKKVADAKATLKNKTKDKRGRVATRVNLGTTQSLGAIKKLIHTVTQLPEFHAHSDAFKKVKWNSYDEVSKAFKDFLNIFEASSK